MNAVVLVTGATGFIGTQVIRYLLQHSECRIKALVRGPNRDGALLRLKRAWWDWPEISSEIGHRIDPLQGDVCRSGLGLDEEQHSGLVSSLTHIVHAAADIRLDAPLAELRRVNVEGTEHVLELTRQAHSDHGLDRFSHISTAYVAGRRKGIVAESDLTDRHGFASNYEASKYEAERMVHAARCELPISVFRPGMVVGDSQSGAVKTFNTLYYPLRLYMTSNLRFMPMRATAKVNLVPVDYVAQAVVRLTLDPRAVGLCFHVVLPEESLPSAAELVEFVREWSKRRLGAELPRPVFVPGATGFMEVATRLSGQRETSRTLSILRPYLEEERTYRRDNMDRLLGLYGREWPALLPPILEYSVYHGFMHRSERTVHEQTLFRLSSRRRPVTYFDVVEGRRLRKQGRQLRSEILRIAASLKAMGISKGDPVAIVGLNSTTYLAIDVAIGLVGAVSVPLYYTSPLAEISDILSSSGARVLFIGVPEILRKCNELPGELLIVDFCRGFSGASSRSNVLAFTDFLAKGEGTEPIALAAVAPSDIATLRYTSGTTGEPKGVAFTHASLRFMAESLASLPPWSIRTNPVTYLSFLPMNHVVEGILATYSPYYAPARLSIHFLENIRDLQSALPMVRPTIFFSVPRFYEKVWERLGSSFLGRCCLRVSGSKVGKALNRLAGKLVLRRAGLDRCSQLITGSAPVSQELLEAFRCLGIEIHNAYGLTEAPLVTLNRAEANRLDTVGQPLPQTEVRIAEDGEVLVRGPQVMAGYLEDGWLHTGDLGHLTSDRHLVLDGRKKDVLINSYGKSICPVKIEMMLKAIRGVVEAMVVGEGRPYCTALLWADLPVSDTVEAVCRSIEAVNAGLSHPEQVRRFAVLPYDLTIERGDLTANLKLRRDTVSRRYADTIASLYRAGESDCRAGA